MPKSAGIAITLLILVVAAACTFTASSSVPPPPQNVDPPSCVARLSYVQGSVSFEPARADEWVSAELNRPYTTGDQVWSTPGARAEFDIGSAAVRAGGETSFVIFELDDNVAQFRLTAGTLNVHVRRLDENEIFEIDTPNAAITLKHAGEYNIEVRPADDVTRLVVRDGEADVSGSTQVFGVRAGHQARMNGDASTEYEVTSAPPRDSFEEFCSVRERRLERLDSTKHVSPEVIGYEDLDKFGAWRVDVRWGPVWVPRAVPVGWAQYRFGHWIWIEPWGWTWIDDTPWGFAPFHYGRWIFVGTDWCWVPGPVHIHPVYALHSSCLSDEGVRDSISSSGLAEEQASHGSL
jgi:hypothetical protein